MNRYIGLLGAGFTAIAMTGCGAYVSSASDKEATDAVALALQAEIQTGNVKNMAAFPVGKSITTNFAGAERFVIAKKVGGSDSSNCSKFDLVVSEPSSKALGMFTVPGDSASAKAVEVCTSLELTVK